MPSRRNFTVGVGAFSFRPGSLTSASRSLAANRNVPAEAERQEICLRPPAVHLDRAARDTARPASWPAGRAPRMPPPCPSARSARSWSPARPASAPAWSRVGPVRRSSRPLKRRAFLLAELPVDLSDHAKLRRARRAHRFLPPTAGPLFGSEPSNVARIDRRPRDAQRTSPLARRRHASRPASRGSARAIRTHRRSCATPLLSTAKKPGRWSRRSRRRARRASCAVARIGRPALRDIDDVGILRRHVDLEPAGDHRVLRRNRPGAP